MAGRELIPPCLFDSAGPLGGRTSITGRHRHAQENVQKKEKVSGRALLAFELFLTGPNNRFPSMNRSETVRDRHYVFFIAWLDQQCGETEKIRAFSRLEEVCYERFCLRTEVQPPW